MKTVVIGASPNPNRYAHRVTQMLVQAGYDTVPLGIKSGQISGLDILGLPDMPVIDAVHTVTLYLGPQNQPPYYTYILSLNPQRLIFNPGTENPELQALAEAEGIKTEYACTLVMLTVDNY